MFLDKAMNGATVIKENGKEILNGLAIHPAKTEKPLELLQKLSNAYCFYRMYQVCRDFDTALDLSLSVGGSKRDFFDELKRNVFTPLQIHRLRKRKRHPYCQRNIALNDIARFQL